MREPQKAAESQHHSHQIHSGRIANQSTLPRDSPLTDTDTLFTRTCKLLI